MWWCCLRLCWIKRLLSFTIGVMPLPRFRGIKLLSFTLVLIKLAKKKWSNWWRVSHSNVNRCSRLYLSGDLELLLSEPWQEGECLKFSNLIKPSFDACTPRGSPSLQSVATKALDDSGASVGRRRSPPQKHVLDQFQYKWDHPSDLNSTLNFHKFWLWNI